MAKSRLNQNLETKTKHHIILMVLGILILLFILLRYGVPMLINMSLFFEKSNTSQNTSSTPVSIILPPTLNNPPNATKDAHINISGTADLGQVILLYVNNTFVDETETKNDKTFSFSNVRLDEGENHIRAKAKDHNQESEFSDDVIVSYLPKAPNLAIDWPADGQSFDHDHNPILLRGTTDPQATVTVNDFRAIVDGSGKFTYNLQMQGGDNHIKVIATDAAGNKTEKDLKVSYSQ